MRKRFSTLLPLVAGVAVLCLGCLGPPAQAQKVNPPAARPPSVNPPSTKPSPKQSAGPSTSPSEASSGEYIEYRSQPELGRITISDCAVRGPRSAEYLTRHADELAKRGVFACTDDAKPRVYTRREKVAGWAIDTLVVIYPPRGEGEDAASGSQRLVVRVNGHKKVDCSIGTSPDGELWVSEVTIHPEDGTLEFRALTADGEELSLPEDWEALDDPTVITDDSFFEDPPDDPSRQPPIKV